MSAIIDLEPKEVFRYFDEILKIPRGSSKTDKIVAYLMDFAAAHGLESTCDETNNVIIRKPATPGYENADIIILQAHHDMVCEKIEGSDFDFETQPIDAYIDGDVIRAKGTTLGGDNGIGVAMILAILDDDTLAHPALECLITADEEIGMVGAFAFDCSQLKGHRMINLDSEFEDVLICSCAGGAMVPGSLPVTRESAKGALIEISIKDLMGGHSGVEIHKGRANAHVLMTRMLQKIAEAYPYRLYQYGGSAKETAIANYATAVIVADTADAESIANEAEAFGKVLQTEYEATEPEMKVSATVSSSGSVDALTASDTKKVLDMANALPDSVLEMSATMPGLVQTSTNLGVMELGENAFSFCCAVRSSMTSQKRWVISKVASVITMAGGTYEVQSDYPGWAYNPNSVLKETILGAYQKLYNQEAAVDAVHAGAECGLFADAIPNIDCVSIGPQMWDVHTPKEHLSIPSTEKTFRILQETLRSSK